MRSEQYPATEPTQPLRPISDMWITPAVTYLPGGRVAPTPEDYDEYGIAGLIERMTAEPDKCAPEVVIWLDTRAAADLKLPTHADQLPTEGERHLCEVDLIEAGWEYSRLSAWTVLTKASRPTVRLGLPHLAHDDNPAIAGEIRIKGTKAGLSTPGDTVDLMAQWRAATGTAWSGTPAMSAHTHMRASIRYSTKPKGRKSERREPRWFASIPDEVHPIEENYAADAWRGRAPRDGHVCLQGWDVIKAHTATAALVRVSPFKLENTGPIPYSRDRAGWWQVRLSPWTLPYLPPPWGADDGPNIRWVSGPTLALLDQLQDPERFGFGPKSALVYKDGYEVLDSWTAGGAREILKPWAEPMKALQAAGADADPARPSSVMLALAAKQAANRGIGAWRRPGGRIHRPDWHDAVVSQNRTNLWRKLWAIAQASEWTAFPRLIATDCVYYPSPSWEPEPPPGMKTDPTGTAFGQFKHETTKELS